MQVDPPSRPRRGRPPTGNALSKTERQRRWRQRKEGKQVERRNNISVALNDKELARIDECATTRLKCNRSEALRYLIDARLDQIDQYAAVHDMILDQFSKLSAIEGLYELIADSQVKTLRGSATISEVREELEALVSSVIDLGTSLIEKFEKAAEVDPAQANEALKQITASFREAIKP